MSRIRTDWLETYLAAVETGSFTAAAERVHRSQSAVSLQIAQLEEAVGHRLLQRGRRGLQPTLAGERLIPHVRRAADAVASVGNVLASDTPALLRLGVPDEYADGPLPDVLARFAATHPEVTLEVECAPSCELASHIQAGSLDMALALQEEIDAPGEPLLEDPTRWVVSARAVPPAEGRPLPLAVFDNDCSWRRWALDSLNRAGIPYRIVFTSRSVPAIRAAIRSGIAAGLLGASTLSGDLRSYPPLEAAIAMPASQLVLLHREQNRPDLEATVRALIREALVG